MIGEHLGQNASNFFFPVLFFQAHIILKELLSNIFHIVLDNLLCMFSISYCTTNFSKKNFLHKETLTLPHARQGNSVSAKGILSHCHIRDLGEQFNYGHKTVLGFSDQLLS